MFSLHFRCVLSCEYFGNLKETLRTGYDCIRSG
jgi:hypothetical protein